MTTKTISTYIAAGYTLSSTFSELLITSMGGVGGTGVTAQSFATISNAGKINASGNGYGITLGAGGEVINQQAGSIVGHSGIYSHARGTVTNYGVIRGTGASPGAHGILLANGGNLTNGTSTDRSALVEGYGGVKVMGAAGTVANFGTILGDGVSAGERGLYLKAGGSVTNGALADTKARIEGRSGVVILGAATVTNFGVIDGAGAAHNAYGVRLVNGGGLTNGTAVDHSALVEGYTGVSVLGGAAGTVVNFGTIQGDGVSGGERGLYLKAGGTVTNGGAGDTAALIEGASGVVLAAAGTIMNYGGIVGATAFGALLSGGGGVLNYGTIHAARYGVELAAAGSIVNYGAIVGETAYGALLRAGGSIINGGGSGLSALVEGYRGVVAFGGVATVKNFGTIQATGGFSTFGVRLVTGGVVTNGSLNNNTAMIEGYSGLNLSGTAAATNFGTISGRGDFAGAGAYVNGDDSLTNGAAGHATALIEGFAGVGAYGTGNTVTNFGTIFGAGGTAVRFNSSTDVLVVEAGCAFNGAVMGGGGTLDLASGVGTLTGLLSTGGNVTVSGSMATTTFQNFATVEVAAGATFSDKGAVSLAAGQTIDDAGTLTLGAIGKNSIVNAGLIETTGAGALTLAGTVKNSGTLAVGGGIMTVNGAVTGTGHATVKGGTLDFASTFNQAVTFTGTTGVLELAKSQTYTATITGFSKTGKTGLDLVDIGFVSSTEATFSGTTTSGVLTVTDGTHTAHINLKGDYTASTFVAASDGHGGVIIHDPPKAAAPPPPWIEAGAGQRFIAALAGFGTQAGGQAHLADDVWRTQPHMLATPRLQAA